MDQRTYREEGGVLDGCFERGRGQDLIQVGGSTCPRHKQHEFPALALGHVELIQVGFSNDYRNRLHGS